MTKQVQSLEQALHVAPAQWTTRRISVTDVGECFYEQCLAILAHVDRVASVVAPDRELTGHLRVAAPPSFAAVVLGLRIHEFLDKHPGLSVDLMMSSATPDLIRDRIDVAVTLQEEPQSKLVHFLLAAVSGTSTASTSRRTSMPGVWRSCCPVTRCGRRTSMPSSRAGWLCGRRPELSSTSSGDWSPDGPEPARPVRDGTGRDGRRIWRRIDLPHLAGPQAA
jgi:DNA-binding transcriptional LysR family regulator